MNKLFKREFKIVISVEDIGENRLYNVDLENFGNNINVTELVESILMASITVAKKHDMSVNSLTHTLTMLFGAKDVPEMN